MMLKFEDGGASANGIPQQATTMGMDAGRESMRRGVAGIAMRQEIDRLRMEVLRLRAMLPEQYAAGFRDGMVAAKPLDKDAPFVVGPDAG
jgi:hypothetical protein